MLSILWVYRLCIHSICIHAFQPTVPGNIQSRLIVTKQIHHLNFERKNRHILHVIPSSTKGANGESNANAADYTDLDIEATTNLAENAPVSPSATLTPSERSIAKPAKSSSRTLPTNWLGEKVYILSTAALIGLTTGTNIAVFKKAVECVRSILYGDGIEIPSPIYDVFTTTSVGASEGEHFLRLSETIPVALAPAVGGLLVGILLKVGGDLPPGLRDTVTEGSYISNCY